MCGRFAAALDTRSLATRFHAVTSPGLPGPSWNIAPAKTVTLLAEDARGTRHLAPARWMFVPRDSPTDRLPYPTFNARVETVLEKRTYAQAARDQRAIIPATGYYEWDDRHRPFYFHDPHGREILIAGLYSWWRRDRSSPWTLTTTILTTAATGSAADVHERMPVLVPPEYVDDWLNPGTPGSNVIPAVAAAGARLSRQLLGYRVHTLRGDGPELTTPAAIRTS